MTDHYDSKVLEVNFKHIRNRNEQKVIDLMPEVLSEFVDYNPERMDIEDIYALTLNNLPARYKQRGTVVIFEPIKNETIQEEIRNAIKVVMNNPNYD